MQSVDEFTPSTTEPVFGSGLVAQTKSQPSTNNEHSDSEKVIPPAEPVVNGQNDVTLTKVTSNENNVTNGSVETVSEHSAVHVNGQNSQSTAETTKEVEQAVTTSEPVVAEKANVVEPVVPAAEPVSSTSVDTVSSEPPSSMDTTPAENTDAAEAPVATESVTPEPKGKSPRGRAKAAAPAPAPTRQSARGRKTASSSTTNTEESSTVENVDVPATTTLNQKESPSRAKNDAPAVSAEPVSTSDDATTSNPISSVGNEVSESPAEVVTPKKRAAPAPAASSAKKAKGRGSTGDVDSGAVASEGAPVETPPKKARASVTKKTPEPPSEEYARKLRPRK